MGVHNHNGINHAHDHHHESRAIFGEKTEFIFAILSGVLLLLGFALQYFNLVPFQFSLGCYLLSYFFGGYYTIIEAYQATIQGKFEIDFLMIFAALGAGFLGEWAEGALLLFLFSLGHSLEHMAMNKARKSISALSNLAPPTAILLRDDVQIEIPAENLQVNDIILIKPNSKIAADGLILSGNSMVDQASITGESIPVQKIAHPDSLESNFDNLDETNRVYAGTINGSLAMEVKVLRISEDSTVARLVKMVSEAETQKSPTQHFTDKFEKYFVPIVIGLVFILCFVFLVRDETFKESFYRAMAVLVSASPCALAISTPSAVLAGIARAARGGVLVKGGGPLEVLGQIDAIAFDKTGTLTEGKPKLTHVIPFGKATEKELLETVIAVEDLSDHPLANAIVAGGEEKLGYNHTYPAEELKAITARGVKANYKGHSIFIGNRLLMSEITKKDVPQNIHDKMQILEKEGHTAMLVLKEKKYLGLIAVMDVPRKDSKPTLKKLKQIGIKKMVMLTGDHQSVADAVGAQIGITDPHGNLLPENKVSFIRDFSSRGQKVAMLGDGVNDAPALAASDIGIAMGAAGSAVALETADVALMADRLDKLPFAILLSRKTQQIIKQNLWISLGMVAILVPLTILGIASIGPAVVAHEGSTLVVVLNALRLLGFKED